MASGKQEEDTLNTIPQNRTIPKKYLEEHSIDTNKLGR